MRWFAIRHALLPQAGEIGFLPLRLARGRRGFFCFSLLLLLPGSLSAAARALREKPAGQAQDARAFAVSTGMCCQRISVVFSRSRRLHRRPRSRGSPLFGYFLWRNRESNPAARMADGTSWTRVGFRRYVSGAKRQQRQAKQKNQEHPHPALSRKRERGKAPIIPNPESRIPNPEFRIPNPESRIPNPQSPIPALPCAI
jgi:hypothetical protein